MPPSSGRLLDIALPPSVDSLENITQLDSYRCNSTDQTFETFLTIDITEAKLNLRDVSILEQAVLQTYNNLNALGTGDVCDNLFLTITEVQIDVTPGNTDDGSFLLRRILKQSASSSTKNVVFGISGNCRGCSESPSLFNDVSGRRRLLDEGPMITVERKQQQTEWAENDTSNVCYCPVNTTQFGRPTQSAFVNALNDRLGVLAAANLTNLNNNSVTEVFQDAPVNCSSLVNTFHDTVQVTLAGYALNSTNLISDQAAQLAQAFATTYNTLTQQYCDPLFRTIISVQIVEVIPNRRVLVESENANDNNRRLAPSSRRGHVTGLANVVDVRHRHHCSTMQAEGGWITYTTLKILR